MPDLTRPVRSAALVAAALALVSCGGSTGEEGVAGVPRLDLEFRPTGNGAAVETYTLVCEIGPPPAGDHPDLEAACAHLESLDDPFAPLPDDLACTQQYGGPQTARIHGRWRDERVDLELSRTDGCRISQWDSFGPVLPFPVGVEIPD
jgi:hypothetical protein